MDHSSGLVFRRPQAASHRRAVVYFCSAVLRPDGERVDHALRLLVALRGGEAIPVIGGGAVPGGAAAGVEHEREAELGFGVALPGRARVPRCGVAVVLGHTVAIVIHPSEGELGADVALVCGAAQVGETGAGRRVALRGQEETQGGR